MKRYLIWCFKNINFSNKKVLDVGGGNGIFSYYAKSKGAKTVINLEPFSSGSTPLNDRDNNICKDLQIINDNRTIQNFKVDEKFDIIILHDSINHLDEELYKKIHLDKSSLEKYERLIQMLLNILEEKGTIIITDCSRYNFWAILNIKNPFAPSIDWDVHQHPNLILKLFNIQGKFSYKLRWSPFKRFGTLGYIISYFGFPFSFFLQSHFNLILKKV